MKTLTQYSLEIHQSVASVPRNKARMLALVACFTEFGLKAPAEWADVSNDLARLRELHCVDLQSELLLNYELLAAAFDLDEMPFLNHGILEMGYAPVNFRECQERLYDVALSEVDLQDKTVVELGSGRGTGAARLAMKAKMVVGIDPVAGAVHAANGKWSNVQNLKFCHATADAIDVWPDNCNLIVCIECVHAIPNFVELLENARLKNQIAPLMVIADAVQISRLTDFRKKLQLAGWLEVFFEDITEAVIKSVTYAIASMPHASSMADMFITTRLKMRLIQYQSGQLVYFRGVWESPRQ